MGEQTLEQVGFLITYLSMPYLIESFDHKFMTFKLFEAPDREEFLREHYQSIRGMVCGMKDGINAEMIDAFPCLEIVGTTSVGLDRVDLAKCRQRNIATVYTPDVLTDDVADLAIALMLYTRRHISASNCFVRQGFWQSKGDY